MGRLIGYIKGKETKVIVIKNPKVLKAVMFCDSNYNTYKETRKSVSSIVATIGGTLQTRSSKTHKNVMLSSTKSEYVALSELSQEVKFISILLEEMTDVQKPSAIYKDNQGSILLAKDRQVGIHTKHIDILHHFLRDMVEDKDIDIKYIMSEKNLRTL